MRSLTILGSCATRDTLEFTFGKYEIKNYFARTSFVSLMSPPLDMKEDSIQLESNFQRRCVYNDISKRFFHDTNENKTDYIVIDLIDERFNLIKTGESYLTKSNEFVGSQIEKDLQKKSEIKRNEQLYPLWKKSTDSFFKKLFETYKPEQIVLHKTLWRERYYNRNGEQHSFKNIAEIQHHNQILKQYYEYIEKTEPTIKVIDMSEGGYLSSETHKWGLAPYHFEDVYYHAFLLQLDELTNG
ncbi:DUF6270 domain-containing protein [Bacillus pinisoli]|uniref:DUF6270 domain-containing protein n=1 Tax=Bacillus pinisoli TaxID=2901866 RepID=UPI001FF29402|nr:DUF6270 domain-containing protein [Bacillus pinisoli]